ncbi:FUSC family protein [Acinetobacter zhairhuonensis]|uniref:FUSC family protein n=1 Tax=Acinetobacter sp. A7.4 TaxID=2919921 RepID=UPI001F4F5FD4|nr:FUSC family protein [Acinetobacter sp. A7.4]MCJ8162820.1 FUSC family protein [Acinetobacter sp. A7.4]
MLLIKPILAFRPSRMDLVFAMKTFIAMLLALFIAFSLDLTYPMWAAGTVIIVAHPYAGMVSSKAVYRLVGTLIGGIVAIFLTPQFVDLPIFFTLVLAGWVGVCLYISLLDRTPRSYVFMLAGYTTVMVVCSSINSISTHSVFDMALGRVLEISVAVLCSAVVSSTLFPVHLGTLVQKRVQKTLDDTREVFRRILTDAEHSSSYTQLLAGITRDTSDIHALAVHLNYERSALQGMTKSLQELLHQVSMTVANLVAMSERIAQLDQMDTRYRQVLPRLHEHVLQFLQSQKHVHAEQLKQLPDNFEQDFTALSALATAEQQIVLNALKMDIRHFMENVVTIKCLWDLIQRGDKRIPEQIVTLTTSYPSLHRDHGVAVRSAVAATIATIISFMLWIYSGWHAGYMMAQLTAVSVCILSGLDNPVPALRLFIRGSIYAAFITMFYAFVIMPEVHEFWQLAFVLAPLSLYLLSMFPNPPLMGLALPMLINFIMSLNLQNRYSTDAVLLIDTALAGIVGPIISILAIYFIRAMSPETSASRILVLHYRAMREALFIPYGVQFRIHLRSMLDRIGVLNSKLVQSEHIKQAMNLALIETSAVINLSRLAEFIQNPNISVTLQQALITLQHSLEQAFLAQEKQQLLPEALKQQVFIDLRLVEQSLKDEPNAEICTRVRMNINNIRSSIFHEHPSVNAIYAAEKGV